MDFISITKADLSASYSIDYANHETINKCLTDQVLNKRNRLLYTPSMVERFLALDTNICEDFRAVISAHISSEKLPHAIYMPPRSETIATEGVSLWALAAQLAAAHAVHESITSTERYTLSQIAQTPVTHNDTIGYHQDYLKKRTTKDKEDLLGCDLAVICLSGTYLSPTAAEYSPVYTAVKVGKECRDLEITPEATLIIFERSGVCHARFVNGSVPDGTRVINHFALCYNEHR